MFRDLKKYSFINAKLRARISKILPEDTIKQMIHSHSISEAIQFLSETSYSIIESIYNKTGDLKLGELELFKQELNLFKEIEKYVQDEVLDFVTVLVDRYEIDNLKNAIRLWFDSKIRGRDIYQAMGYIYRGKIHYDFSIDKIINAGSVDEIIDELSLTPYLNIIKEYSATIEKEKTLFSIETALDHYYYKMLISKANMLKGLDRNITLRLVGVEIDLQNISLIIRFKSFYDIPPERILSLVISDGFNLDSGAILEAYSSQDITNTLRNLIKKSYPALFTLLQSNVSDSYSRLLLIDRILEEIMLHEVKRTLCGYPFTIGIILSYFILKRNEIKKIKTILNAKLYNLPENQIAGMI